MFWIIFSQFYLYLALNKWSIHLGWHRWIPGGSLATHIIWYWFVTQTIKTHWERLIYSTFTFNSFPFIAWKADWMRSFEHFWSWVGWYWWYLIIVSLNNNNNLRNMVIDNNNWFVIIIRHALSKTTWNSIENWFNNYNSKNLILKWIVSSQKIFIHL